MASICRINVSETNMLFCPIKLKCGQSEISVDYSLLDTGAGVCHMTYAMWLSMGLHKVCWDNNSKLCRLMGIDSPENFTFDALPLTSAFTKLGDDSKVKVYEFRLDTVVLGNPSLGNNHYITFENITVRLINRKTSAFIVGWNVLKYLEINYIPSPKDSACQLTFSESGQQLFEQDRKNRIANHLQNIFSYKQL